jgi:hypothetical protein
MEDAEQRRGGWIIKRHLNADALKEYVARHAIERGQVVAITEPQDGQFTLIFEPDAEQRVQLEAEEGQVAETLDTLFGAPVTPVQAPSGAEVETVVTIPASPATPLVAPPGAPSTEPSPS